MYDTSLLVAIRDVYPTNSFLLHTARMRSILSYVGRGMDSRRQYQGRHPSLCARLETFYPAFLPQSSADTTPLRLSRNLWHRYGVETQRYDSPPALRLIPNRP